MSEGLAKSHCAIHVDRTAVARCPSCRRFFCGECVTEHSGKFVCASCLAGASEETRTQRKARPILHPAPFLQLALAMVAVWALLYFFARFLGDIPDSFHDGTIWE